AVTMAQAQTTQEQDHSAHHPPEQSATPAPAPQSPMMGGGMMGGGMMGQGMGGSGGMMRGGGFADQSGYLESLKGQLGITANQEKPWAHYTGVVKGTAEQMKALHQSMFQTMGTQTWEQRRESMNQMFAERQEAY